MTENRRLLILETIDGHMALLPLVFSLHNNYRDCDNILKKLITNKITGKRLEDWIKNEHGNSPLRAFNYVLTLINKDNRYKTMLHRDFYGAK